MKKKSRRAHHTATLLLKRAALPPSTQEVITIDIVFKTEVTPYFADGISEVIFTTRETTFDQAMHINVYIPIQISLASAKIALDRFKEANHAEGSKI